VPTHYKIALAEPLDARTPPISFAQAFAAKPAVSVAIAGVESGANRWGYSVEATDISETGFKIIVRRSQGVLYGVTVNWLAYGTRKP